MRIVRMLWLLCILIAAPLRADEAVVPFTAGTNLVSLPLRPEPAWTARDLMRATGSPLVTRVMARAAGGSSFDTFVEGLAKQPFELQGGRGYLIQTSSEGSFVVTGTPWPASLVDRGLRRGIDSVGLTSGAGRLDALGLAERGRAAFLVRSAVGEGGRGRLEAFVPGLASQPFALLPGQGYLLSVPVDLTVTLFDPPADDRAPSLRIVSPADDQQAVLGTPLTVVAEASDESGIERVEFRLGSASAVATTLPFEATFSFTGTPLETSTFLVKAFDRSGNVTTRQARVVALEPVTSSTVRGLVQEAVTKRPIPGVTVSVLGTVTATEANPLGGYKPDEVSVGDPLTGLRGSTAGLTITTTTDEQGRFLFEDVAPGDQSLRFDGSTGRGGPYAGYTLDVRVLAGVDNPVLRPVFLPLIDRGTLTDSSPSRTAVVVSAPASSSPDLPGIALTVPAGAAVGPDGRPFTGQLSLTEVPAEFTPSSLPEGVRPGLVSTLQPAGVLFNRPLQISYPNVDRLPPGARADIYQVNSATGRFEVIGTGTVDVTGRTIVSNGAILTSASWHAAAPPLPPKGSLCGSAREHGCHEAFRRCGDGSVSLDDGAYFQEILLPAFDTLDGPVIPRLLYSSGRANGRVPICLAIDYTGATPPPRMAIVLHAPDFPAVEAKYFTPAANKQEYRLELDGSKLPSGTYPVTVEIVGDYRGTQFAGQFAGSMMSTFVRGHVNVRHDANSPFGAGWALLGVDFVRAQSGGSPGAAKAGLDPRRAGLPLGAACGTVVVEEGNGLASRFTPALQATASISRPGERDLYRFPASFGDTVSLRVERLGDLDDGGSTLDPAVEISNSKGVVMGRDDDSGSGDPAGPGRNASLEGLSLRATDVYTVAVIGSGGTSGRYSVILPEMLA